MNVANIKRKQLAKPKGALVSCAAIGRALQEAKGKTTLSDYVGGTFDMSLMRRHFVAGSGIVALMVPTFPEKIKMKNKAGEEKEVTRTGYMPLDNVNRDLKAEIFGHLKRVSEVLKSEFDDQWLIDTIARVTIN